MTTPWHGAIPTEDEESFRIGTDEPSPAMEAGVRPALIIVDMTRAFVDSSYRTGYSPTGKPALAANSRLLAAARASRVPVFFTKSRPESELPATPSERGRWKRRGVPSEVPENLPNGDVIAEELTPVPGEVVIYKHGKPSAFFGTELSSLLTYHGVDTTIITGMVTSGCIRATVIDAFQHNYFVIVPHECCADRSQISHKVGLFDMHMKYADVVGVDDVLAYFSDISGGSGS